MWYKTPDGEIIETKVLEENNFVTPTEGYHVRISSKVYFAILFDDNKYQELDADLKSGDPLEFEDTKKYADRIKETIKKTGLNDAVSTAYGKTSGQEIVVACMDFAFIGGSMGSVVGEKISRAILVAIEKMSIYDDFKIRWGTYDGSRIFPNANGQNLCSINPIG